MNYRISILVAQQPVNTLADILPQQKPIKMLIIGKTPAPVSVEAGHYFQGRQGQMFWGILKDYQILKVRTGFYEDEELIENGFGITDIVKTPRAYGSEPTAQEYQANAPRIIQLIAELHPKVTLFVYKGALDALLKHHFRASQKSTYGFNVKIHPSLGDNIFAFPMPGTPCTKAQQVSSMIKLRDLLR